MLKVLPFLVALALVIQPGDAAAATWYIGTFSGSNALDDIDCGTGKGSHPSAHPCRTLAYFTANRQAAMSGTNTVLLAPGTYAAPNGSGSNCFLPRANTTYRAADAAGNPTFVKDTVTIDNSNAAPSAAPCGTMYSYVGYNPTPAFSNFSIQYIRMIGCHQGASSGCILLGGDATNVSTGVTLRGLRVDAGHAAQNAVLLGRADKYRDNDARTLDGTVVDDCEFSNAILNGLWLTHMTNATITNNLAHHNGPVGGCQPGNECDGDGIHLGGVINSLIDGNVAYGNAEDGIDSSRNGGPGNELHLANHGNTFQNNKAYDNANDQFVLKGNRDEIVRNNIVWCTTGKCGAGFGQESCSHKIKYYNNTAWMQGSVAFRTWDNCYECEFRNNLARCNSSGACVLVDLLTTNPTTVWMNNVIVNEGSGGGFVEQLGGGGAPCRVGPVYPTTPNPGRTTGTLYADSAAGLSTFRADGDAGHLFGSESGDTDSWAATPTLVNAGVPNADNLHLVPGDTVARDRGAPLTPVFVDIDGDARPTGASWDVGADEWSGTTAPSAPQLLSVSPLP